MWTGVTALVLVAAGAISLQLVLLSSDPIAHGSTSWAPGELDECPQFTSTDTAMECVVVDFVPGGPVGIGFSVRNTGRLPLTIESIESFGTQSDIMLAVMHPVLPPEGAMFSPDETHPFEPVVLSPGEEATVQLMGQMRACDAARDHWLPGGGLILTNVRLNVRWLVMSTEVEIPLRQVLRIDAPEGRNCT
jgi:hypothetical protein